MPFWKLKLVPVVKGLKKGVMCTLVIPKTRTSWTFLSLDLLLVSGHLYLEQSPSGMTFQNLQLAGIENFPRFKAEVKNQFFDAFLN